MIYKQASIVHLLIIIQNVSPIVNLIMQPYYDLQSMLIACYTAIGTY